MGVSEVEFSVFPRDLVAIAVDETHLALLIHQEIGGIEVIDEDSLGGQEANFLDKIQSGESQFLPRPGRECLLDDGRTALKTLEGFSFDFSHEEADGRFLGIPYFHLRPGKKILLEAGREGEHILEAPLHVLHLLGILPDFIFVDFHQKMGRDREGVDGPFSAGGQGILLPKNQWLPLGIKDFQDFRGRGRGSPLDSVEPPTLDGWGRGNGGFPFSCPFPCRRGALVGGRWGLKEGLRGRTLARSGGRTRRLPLIALRGKGRSLGLSIFLALPPPVSYAFYKFDDSHNEANEDADANDQTKDKEKQSKEKLKNRLKEIEKRQEKDENPN